MRILESTMEIAVRFSETDAMGVIWHGNYLKFFEDAREKFGEDHGMQYLDVFGHGFYTPIVKSEINHKSAVYYGQKVKVNIRLEDHPASKIVFKYEIINLSTGEIAATGTTTQVFLSVEERIMELVKPEFYVEWEAKQNWKSK